MVIRLSCQQGISLGPKSFRAHEVQRELIVEDFRTKNIALTYAVNLPHRCGGSRFHDTQLTCYVNRLVQLGDATFPTVAQLCTNCA
ncbi:hypothetical protein D3C84_692030 [compost metagenome]